MSRLSVVQLSYDGDAQRILLCMGDEERQSVQCRSVVGSDGSSFQFG